MTNCVVWFNNDTKKLFCGTTSSIIKQVYDYCETNNLITVNAKWDLEREDSNFMKNTIKETDGKHNGETIYCPVNGWDCPYYENGVCYIKDPIKECDDFSSFFDSWEDWEEL